MYFIWESIAIVAAVVAGLALVRLIRAELGAYRWRQMQDRLEVHERPGIAPRELLTSRFDYSEYDVDALLRNRSERWE